MWVDMKNTLYSLLLLMILLGGCSQSAPQGIAITTDAPVGVDLQVGEEVTINCAGEEQRYEATTAVSGAVTCLAADTPTVIVTPTETAIDTPTAAQTMELPTATATETFTPIPSDTPTETNTPAPTDTPTAPSTPTPQLTPVASAPLCPTHDDRFWHGLWDAARGCHYDHVHGVDPNHEFWVGRPISGTKLTLDSMRVLQGGVDFGYGWQTLSENANKHRGYVGNSAVNLPREQQNYLYMPEANRKFINDFNIIFHYDHPVREGTSRFHSMSVYAVGCERDNINCGDFFSGGISDTGDLHSPYKTDCENAVGSNRPTCPPLNVWEYQRHNPPYWAYSTKDEALRALNGGYLARNIPENLNLPSNRMVWDNYSSDRTRSVGNRLNSANLLVHINARNYTSSAYFDKATKRFEYVCPLSDCIAVNDAVYVYALIFEVPANLPKDAQGYVNYLGWTDRAGRIVTNCTEISVECVPLRIRHLKPGAYIYDMKQGFLPDVRTWGDGVVTTGARYFDVTPPNVPCDGNPAKSCSWIRLPSALGQ